VGLRSVFIIDFVNDPKNVRRAFSLYDEGATLEDVQDPNVVYDIKQRLDDEGLYDDQDLENFQRACFATRSDIVKTKEPQHRALYEATERPTRIFNQRVKSLRSEVEAHEAAYEKARARGDLAGMKAADHLRKEKADQLKTTFAYKTGLARFCSTYAYVAQLIEFNDPALENFAAFAKLLQKRLDGEAPENVDLRGLVLTGYGIKTATDAVPEDEQVPILKPIEASDGISKGDDPQFLAEIIEKLNHLFGDTTPLRDQATFVNHIAAIAKENDVVVAQIENNTRAQAWMEICV